MILRRRCSGRHTCVLEHTKCLKLFSFWNWKHFQKSTLSIDSRGCKCKAKFFYFEPKVHLKVMPCFHICKEKSRLDRKFSPLILYGKCCNLIYFNSGQLAVLIRMDLSYLQKSMLFMWNDVISMLHKIFCQMRKI